jgi:Na+-driven multidrug efflux pump
MEVPLLEKAPESTDKKAVNIVVAVWRIWLSSLPSMMSYLCEASCELVLVINAISLGNFEVDGIGMGISIMHVAAYVFGRGMSSGIDTL